ncbi:MAG: helix-turn-helix domain-containing protein [Chloroflexi bacterium]|nr:helix-turn-helix domain-containing protein [Chloroflexota bacterium]
MSHKYIKRILGIRELSEETGFSPRQIHFMSHKGIIKSNGKARGAYYGEKEVQTLNTVAHLRSLGLDLKTIKTKIKQEYQQNSGYLSSRMEYLKFELTSGVEIFIDRDIEVYCGSDGINAYLQMLKDQKSMLMAFGYHKYIEEKAAIVGGE